jgi:TPR repeat protein
LTVEKIKRPPWKEKAMSNDSEAVLLFKISADRGNADAQFELGLFYSNGSRGLPKDWPEAERLFKRAARQGHIRAQQFLESNALRMPIAKWLYTRGGWPNS